MNTVESTYLGGLRTESVHVRSGNKMLTDAPVDNQGKGETFSPTDTVAVGLLTCMLTVVGIQAQKHDWQLGEFSGEVKKIMTDNPRRIIQLVVHLNFKGHNLNAQNRAFLERIAIHCPVALSLHPDINQQVRFSYD